MGPARKAPVGLYDGVGCIGIQRELFARAMSVPEEDMMMELLQRCHDSCASLHIDCFLMYGTLLGYERHGGFIPWDDDVDVAVVDPPSSSKSSLDDLWDALAANVRFMLVDFWGGKKLCLRGRPLTPDRPWSWPFLDIFIFRENAAKRSVGGVDDVYAVDWIYPLRAVDFGGGRAPVNVPNRARDVLSLLYGPLWESSCMSSDYDHRNERRLESGNIEVECACLARGGTDPLHRLTPLDLHKAPRAERQSEFESLGVAHIFVLGLDVNSERSRHTLADLASVGARHVRWMQGFHGLTEWEVAKKALPEMAVRPPSELDAAGAYFKSRGFGEGDVVITAAAQGWACSHLYMWRELGIMLAPDEWALIFGDDVALHSDFNRLFRDAFLTRPKDATILNFFTSTASVKQTECTPDTTLTWTSDAGTGTPCFAINGEGARYLLGEFSKYDYVATADSRIFAKAPRSYRLLHHSDAVDFPGGNGQGVKMRCSGLVTSGWSDCAGSSISLVNSQYSVRLARSGRSLSLSCVCVAAAFFIVLAIVVWIRRARFLRARPHRGVKHQTRTVSSATV